MRVLVLADDIDYAAVAGPFKRGPPQAGGPPAADHRAGRPHRWHHAGGADAAGGPYPPPTPQARSRGRMIVADRQADLAADRARALALVPVSRETAARLDRFVEVLLEWQQRMNLIAPSTEPILWTRHIADSLQLLSLAPEAQAMGRSGFRGRISRTRDRLRAGGHARRGGASGGKQNEEGRLLARSGTGDRRARR